MRTVRKSDVTFISGGNYILWHKNMCGCCKLSVDIDAALSPTLSLLRC